jgi:hypothetical protein
MRMLKGQRNSGSIIGGVAQLGERLNGIQEASSSILLISTKNKKGRTLAGSSLFYETQVSESQRPEPQPSINLLPLC